jgi:hypothetical protein
MQFASFDATPHEARTFATEREATARSLLT